jgi:NAD+ synthase (glutamine-hydrolysing)
MSFDIAAEYDIVCDFELENDTNDLKYRFVDPHPFVPADDEKRRERCEEIFAIQAAGLAKRLEHVGSKGCVIGISGGLDSTLALLVSVEAMKLLGKPMSDIIGVTMPGFGTTDRTYNNALELMKSLGVKIKEISIKDACVQHFKDIGHNPEIKDITYENTQARERTQILFDIANQQGCLLVGTGDLSEMAMGWCTYNGDHMSMYGVNASVPKTLVRYLVAYVADISDETTKNILLDVLDTPVSPELLPPDENGEIAQKTEDNIGPYELHDFFLYHFVRFGFDKEKLSVLAQKAFDGIYDKATVDKWLAVFIRRFFISQFKRSCVPDSPKVGSVSLSPRGDWRMPSDASFDDFI